MMVSGILADKGFHAFDGEQRVVAGQKTLRIWVLVADSTQAFVFRHNENGLEQICHAKATGKQMTAVDGHSFKLQGLIGHERAHQEKSHHLDLIFAQRLVEWLDLAEKEKAFDEIILVAAPHTLGNIRGYLTKNLQGRVRRELNKDLTKMPPAEIQNHITEIM